MLSAYHYWKLGMSIEVGQLRKCYSRNITDVAIHHILLVWHFIERIHIALVPDHLVTLSL
jgi:hypothetical protein